MWISWRILKSRAFTPTNTENSRNMDIHQVIYNVSLCSSGSGTNWLLAFSFSSRVCGTEGRQGKKVRGGGDEDWEIKKRNLLPKSPQSYQPYVVCLERWIPFHPKPWNENLHPLMPFSPFLIFHPKPLPDQIPLPSTRYGAVFLYLSYPIHFSMHIFTFSARSLWILLWLYSVFCAFHFAMNEEILQCRQMRFLSPRMALKKGDVTEQWNKDKH